MTELTESAASVLVIGPLPPPVTGYSVITERMVERLRKAGPIDAVDISANGLARSGLYHLRRCLRMMCALWALVSRPARRGRILYIAIAGGAGVIYDLALVSIARALGYRLFVHHHAFAYLDRRSRLTAVLMRVAGTGATHICLCETMARRLRERYPQATRTVILSNAAFVMPVTTERRPREGAIRIGFLSNLTLAKGLDTTIQIFRSLRTAYPDIVLSIGGPAPDEQARALLASTRAEFGLAVDYRGAVYGEAKSVFFQDLDVFLFPTRYSNEAEPLVMLEALAAGVPVLATARGCIPDDLPAADILHGSETDIVTSATALITQWARDPARMQQASKTALDRAATLHSSACAQLDALIDTMTPIASSNARA